MAAYWNPHAPFYNSRFVLFNLQQVFPGRLQQESYKVQKLFPDYVCTPKQGLKVEDVQSSSQADKQESHDRPNSPALSRSSSTTEPLPYMKALPLTENVDKAELEAKNAEVKKSCQHLRFAEVQLQLEKGQMKNKAMAEELSALRKALKRAKYKAKKDTRCRDDIILELERKLAYLDEAEDKDRSDKGWDPWTEEQKQYHAYVRNQVQQQLKLKEPRSPLTSPRRTTETGSPGGSTNVPEDGSPAARSLDGDSPAGTSEEAPATPVHSLDGGSTGGISQESCQLPPSEKERMQNEAMEEELSSLRKLLQETEQKAEEALLQLQKEVGRKDERVKWLQARHEAQETTLSQHLHLTNVQLEKEQRQNKAMEEKLSSLLKVLQETEEKAQESNHRAQRCAAPILELEQQLEDAKRHIDQLKEEASNSQEQLAKRFSFRSGMLSSCQPTQVLPDRMRDKCTNFLPDEFLPLLFEFLPVAEVAEMEIRAVSSFFASPKVWVAHLVKLMDVDSVLEYERANTKNPVLEYVEYQQSAFWDNSGRKPSLELKREGSERFQGYRIWMNGLFKWHAYNPDISFHVVKVVTGWFASETTGLDRLLGKKMCAELLCDGLRDLRLEIANGLLPVLSANRSCFKTCKTVTRFLQACNCAFPFLSKSFVLKLVEILTSWSLNDETWRDLKAQLREQIMRITDVILPTDQALLASRCINKIGMAEEDSEGGIEDVFAIHGQKLKALLMES